MRFCLLGLLVLAFLPSQSARDTASGVPATSRGGGAPVRGKLAPVRGRGGLGKPTPSTANHYEEAFQAAPSKPTAARQMVPNLGKDVKLAPKLANLTLKTSTAVPDPGNKPSAVETEKVATDALASAVPKEQPNPTDNIVQMIFDDTADIRAGGMAELEARMNAQGPHLLDTLGIVDRLRRGLSTGAKGKAPPAKVAALHVLGALAARLGRRAEAYLLPLLSPALQCAKVAPGPAHKACEALVASANPLATKLMLTTLANCAHDDDRLVAAEALSLLARLAEGEAAFHLSHELYEVVPLCAQLMWHANDKVVGAATKAMTAVTKTCFNRDLIPFIPAIIGAIQEPDHIPECVHKLAATVFVQEIRSPALSVTVPLLSRGLVERETVIRRKSCTIVDNMCKMIEHAEEAVAFMPKILPLVLKASKDIPDPEARQVAGRALASLQQIESMAMEAKKLPLEEVIQALRAALPERLRTPTPAAAEASLGNDTSSDATASAPTHAAPASVMPMSSASNVSLPEGFDFVCRHVGTLCATLIANRNFSEPAWEAAVVPYLQPFLVDGEEYVVATELREACFRATTPRESQEFEDEEGEDLCNIEFSLGYGALMLLTNTRLHMKRGKRYGLCGPNGCGKSTLMKAIVNGQVEGFPPADKVRTVYVEHDIQATDANASVLEFVFSDPRLQGESKEEVIRVLKSVGFTPVLLEQSVTTLSGGWKMKVALARAMLMKADILLLDEPTNHLDVNNVAWLQNYLIGLENVTSMLVSHDGKFLDRVCTHITHFEKNRKLKNYLGNLSHFVKCKPEAKVYYELTNEFLKFTFPEPGFLEGVKSKGKPILRMTNVEFTYPGNTVPTVRRVSLACSLASRVAVIGPNGAGKSTIIRLLTGEYKPGVGEVWKHPNLRIAYVAQHAFFHLEKHQDLTPNQYIQWRYAGGEDKESMSKESKKLTEEELAQVKAAQTVQTEDGLLEKRVLEEIVSRRKAKNGYEYEIKWVNLLPEKNTWYDRDKLIEMGFTKIVNRFDEREALRLGTAGKALTAKEVEKALGDMGLEAEFATHNRIRGLSGGQKVKVVLAAAMWEHPHLLVLDEPTNYLDRDSLGALAAAIRDYAGGVIMISHNREFTDALCPETWLCDEGRLRREGESADEDVRILNPADSLLAGQNEVKDSFGNVVKVEKKMVLTGKDLKKYKKIKDARRKRGEAVSDSEFGE